MHPDHAGSRQAHLLPGTAPASRPLAGANPTSRYSPSGDTNIANTEPGQSLRAGRPQHLGHGNNQDSVGSIVNDPFFQRYSAGPPDAADDDSDGSSIYQSLDNDEDYDDRTATDHDYNDRDSNDNTPSQDWPPPRRESLTAPPSSHWVCPSFQHTDPHLPGLRGAGVSCV